MIFRLFLFLTIPMFFGCSNTEPSEDNFSDLEEITSYPKLYSYENNESRKSINSKYNKILSITNAKLLVPAFRGEKNRIIHPLNSITKENHTIGVFLERDSTISMVQENDILHLVIYDKNGKETDSQNFFLLDIYDSFTELIITDDKHLCIQHCDLEYSPDPESEQAMLDGEIDYKPEIISSHYLISKDSLKLKLIETKISYYEE